MNDLLENIPYPIAFDLSILDYLISDIDTPEKELVCNLLKRIKIKPLMPCISSYLYEYINKLSKVKQEIIKEFFLPYGLLVLKQHPKELELGEFYLRYGLLSRKKNGKKRASEIAQISLQGINLLATYDYNNIGKYAIRQRINTLNKRFKAIEIDIGSPEHILQILDYPQIVETIHKAQEKVFYEEVEKQNELKQIQKQANFILWGK